MGWIVFTVLFLIGAVVVKQVLGNYTAYTKRKDADGHYMYSNGDYIMDEVRPYKKLANIISLGIVGLAIIFTVACSVFSVPTGHTGILTTFGRVMDNTYDAGISFKAPYQSVITMDNRVQKAVIEMNCFSSDIQEVSCVYTLNYQISKSNAQELYRTVGTDYYDTVVTPVVAESVKTVTARYTAEELIGNRDSLAAEIETILTENLMAYNIEVVSTAIEDLDFTDAFTNAVEAKQVAAQAKLQAEIEQAQAIAQASADAEVVRIQAEADLEKAKLNADARAYETMQKADAERYAAEQEAEGNRALNESMTDNLLDYYRIEQWNGEYPTTYMSGEGADILFGVN